MLHLFTAQQSLGPARGRYGVRRPGSTSSSPPGVSPASVCDDLTTRGTCYQYNNCRGNALGHRVSCPYCRDQLLGRSFKSDNSGRCYQAS